MTGYELSREWFNFCFDNPEKVKPNHTALYFFIIEHCNRLGWKQKFGLPTEMAKEAIGIKSYNTFIDTLRDLIDWKFIIIVEKSKNQYSSNIISISKFNEASALSNNNKALDKAMIKHVTKQGESTDQCTYQSICSINKLYNNKQLTNNLKLIVDNLPGVLEYLSLLKESKVKEDKKEYIYSDFYDSEIQKSDNDENYIKTVKAIFGDNNLKIPLTVLLKMESQLSYSQFQKIWYVKQKYGFSIISILESMHNWGNPKKYKTIYGTFQTFAKNENPKVSWK